MNKKNHNKVIIEDCSCCPNTTLKFVKEDREEYMFCQSGNGCVQLRKKWGTRSIPDWCPLLKNNE